MIKWYDWSKAFHISWEHRDREITKLIKRLETSEKDYSYTVCGDMLLLGLRNSYGQIEVYDCKPLRHTWDAKEEHKS